MDAEIGLVERMLLEGFAEGNTDIVDELCSPEIIEHQLGLAGQGAEAIAKIKRGIADVHAGFPDLSFTIADSARDGDTVWVRAEATGTNTGPFMGPPTGASVDFTVVDIATIRDGRIVEHWGVPDRFAIALQLGRIAVPR